MRWPFVIPVFALIIAVAAITGALALRGDDSDDPPSAPDSRVEQTVALSTAPTATPRVAGDVCQDVFKRTESGGERVFNAKYTQVVEAKGISIVAGANVSGEAVENARQTVETVFAGNDLAEPLAAEGAYIIVTDGNEGILDLPEFECLEGGRSSSIIEHACGIADRADYPVATVNEWDLLDDERGPCGGHNILYHEIGHLVQGWSLAPQDYFDVKYYYQAALDSGRYKNYYAATNPNEYFAEATQAYFYSVDQRGAWDRDWLEKYDLDIWRLVDRIYSGK